MHISTHPRLWVTDLTMTALMLICSLGLAQEETAPPLSGYVWTTEEVTLSRWLDADLTSGQVSEDTRVEVVLVDGDQVRIRSGLSFGWVPLTALDPSSPDERAE